MLSIDIADPECGVRAASARDLNGSHAVMYKVEDEGEGGSALQIEAGKRNRFCWVIILSSATRRTHDEVES
jgi:hypothetical protein